MTTISKTPVDHALMTHLEKWVGERASEVNLGALYQELVNELTRNPEWVAIVVERETGTLTVYPDGRSSSLRTFENLYPHRVAELLGAPDPGAQITWHSMMEALWRAIAGMESARIVIRAIV